MMSLLIVILTISWSIITLAVLLQGNIISYFP